jgi:CheY-like chemotaxis protein
MKEKTQQTEQPFVILMADDDLDDISLVADALAECPFPTNFRSVSDGYELIQYLHRRGFYASAEAPVPDLILLDLNMPKRNGTEVLAELKTTPGLRGIPIVILTTSDGERDHYRTSNLGADGYLTKPNRYEELVEMMNLLKTFQARKISTK